MRRTEAANLNFCSFHQKEVEAKIQVGLNLVQFCWGNRIRLIEKPMVDVSRQPVPTPTRFKEHLKFANSNWRMEKNLIVIATNFLRDNVERFKIENISRLDRIEFERRFRGTETSIEGIPLVFKIWSINAQVREFFGHSPDENALATETEFKIYFEKMENRIRNQGSQPDGQKLWPPAIKRDPEGPDSVSNFNKSHLLAGVIGGNEFGQNFPLVGLGFQVPTPIIQYV